jgi:hypothetical protein
VIDCYPSQRTDPVSFFKKSHAKALIEEEEEAAKKSERRAKEQTLEYLSWSVDWAPSEPAPMA